MEKTNGLDTNKSKLEPKYSFSPFYTFLESPERRQQQPLTLDIFALSKKTQELQHHQDSIFYDDDNSSLVQTYDSIFGQFKEEKEPESNSWNHLKMIGLIFLSKVGCTLMLMMLLALPMSMVVIGVSYKDVCPIEPFIPIYLIVGGSFGIVKMLSIIIQRITYNGDIFQSDKSNEEERPIAWLFVDGVLNLFLFTWFVAGNIWVYSKYKPNYTPPPHQPFNYCNKTVYVFAFWVITTSYLMLGLICLCTCCLAACASCTAFFLTKSSNSEMGAEDEVNGGDRFIDNRFR
ncbi:transmembrane protein 272-like [Clytia hemisphaerica]|uniref:Uncharacterized protein n=2 Tax=Clytia hemisphaerica TaxID=252671 RepID=A0A7M5XKY0_9CNID